MTQSSSISWGKLTSCSLLCVWVLPLKTVGQALSSSWVKRYLDRDRNASLVCFVPTNTAAIPAVPAMAVHSLLHTSSTRPLPVVPPGTSDATTNDILFANTMTQWTSSDAAIGPTISNRSCLGPNGSTSADAATCWTLFNAAAAKLHQAATGICMSRGRRIFQVFWQLLGCCNAAWVLQKSCLMSIEAETVHTPNGHTRRYPNIL